MTLLVAVLAAVISTVVWYVMAPKDEYKVSTLCFMYWGASLMWLVDALFEYFGEYMGQAEAYFADCVLNAASDLTLGVCVVALGLVIWVVTLLIKDPKGKIKQILKK